MRIETHEYDDQGRIVQTMVETEAEWDEQERTWMLALTEYEASLCPMCGRPIEVCTAEGSELRVRVPAPHRCHFKTAVERAREKYKDHPHPGALMYSPYLWEG